MDIGHIQVEQEVLDIIVSFLRNDKPALRACSLTCRAFRDASQALLFSSLVVKLPATAEPETPKRWSWARFKDRQKRKQWSPSRSWVDYCNFFEENPRLTKGVCHVAIDMANPPPIREHSSVSSATFPIIPPSSLVEFLNRFPLLECVHLAHLRFKGAEPTQSGDVNFRLHSLTLHWCEFTNVLTAFPATLRALKPSQVILHDIRCESLRSLPERVNNTTSLQSYLNTNPSPSPAYPLDIRNLCVIASAQMYEEHVDDDEVFVAIPYLIAQCCSTLEEFVLTQSGWQLRQDLITLASSRLSLQHTEKLRTFKTWFIIHPDIEWDTYLLILFSLPPTVEHIEVGNTLASGVDAIPDLPLPSAATLEGVIRRLPSLRSFTFRWALEIPFRSEELVARLISLPQLLPEPNVIHSEIGTHPVHKC